MFQRVKGQYYEMGFRLLSGIIVDAELSDKLQGVLEDARQRICQLLDENREHLLETESSSVYPFGKQTDISYVAPKGTFSLTFEQRKELLEIALKMEPVQHVFECDFRDIDRTKAMVQRCIEDEKMSEGGSHE